MPYDWRELIFKELLELHPDEPMYFTKRIRKAQYLFTEDELEPILGDLTDFFIGIGLQQYGLPFIEQKLMGKAGLKLRNGESVRTVSKNLIFDKLSLLDSELDIMIKQKAPSIRFSGSVDFKKN